MMKKDSIESITLISSKTIQRLSEKKVELLKNEYLQSINLILDRSPFYHRDMEEGFELAICETGGVEGCGIWMEMLGNSFKYGIWVFCINSSSTHDKFIKSAIKWSFWRKRYNALYKN